MTFKEHLKWVRTMLATPVKRRKEWVKTIIDGIRSYRSDDAATKKGAVFLSDMIEDESVWEIVGFAVNQQYVRVDGDKELLDCVFVHPWGTPNLLLKHKKLPIVITVGPGIRWNESVLQEVKENQYNDDVVGFTG